MLCGLRTPHLVSSLHLKRGGPEVTPKACPVLADQSPGFPASTPPPSRRHATLQVAHRKVALPRSTRQEGLEQGLVHSRLFLLPEPVASVPCGACCLPQVLDEPAPSPCPHFPEKTKLGKLTASPRGAAGAATWGGKEAREWGVQLPLPPHLPRLSCSWFWGGPVSAGRARA